MYTVYRGQQGCLICNFQLSCFYLKMKHSDTWSIQKICVSVSSSSSSYYNIHSNSSSFTDASGKHNGTGGCVCSAVLRVHGAILPIPLAGRLIYTY